MRLRLKLERVREQTPPLYMKAVTSPAIIGEAWAHLSELSRETFIVVVLDARHRYIGHHTVSEGTPTTSLVHPAEVFKPVMLANGQACYLIHNHPSGDPEPSEDDIKVTQRLTHAGELLGIRVLDHIVIGDGCYVSFAERGLL